MSRDLLQLFRAAERQSCGQSSAAVGRRLRQQLDAVERRLRELEQIRHELSSLLAMQKGGCTDELCLCNVGAVVRTKQLEASLPARRA